MNYELRITNRVKIIFFVALFIILNSAFVIPASAHLNGGFWTPGDPIVPCGPNYYDADGNYVVRDPCTQCELLHLVRHLVDFILLAATPILATAFFILAGVYMMLGGARPDMLATGKRIFTSTMIGLVIVMLAWLITNTVIRTLAETIIVDGSSIVDTSQWWQISCENLGLDNTPGGGGGGGQCTDFGGGYYECVGGVNSGLQCDPNNGNLDCP